MKTDMINSMRWGLILLLLAQNCIAETPIQLSGSTGRIILENVTNAGINDIINATTNSTANGGSNLTTSAAQTIGGLWGWGKIPIGHSVNQTGELISNPITNDPMVAVPPRSPL